MKPNLPEQIFYKYIQVEADHPDKLHDCMLSAIRAAIAAEREACAKVAEDDCPCDGGVYDQGCCGGRIATLIRARKT